MRISNSVAPDSFKSCNFHLRALSVFLNISFVSDNEPFISSFLSFAIPKATETLSQFAAKDPKATITAPIPVAIRADFNPYAAAVVPFIAAVAPFCAVVSPTVETSAALDATDIVFNPAAVSLTAFSPLVNFIAPSTLDITFSTIPLSIPIALKPPSKRSNESKAPRVTSIFLSNDAVFPSIFIVTPSNAAP